MTSAKYICSHAIPWGHMGEKTSHVTSNTFKAFSIFRIQKQHLQTDLVPFILYINRFIAVTLITDEHFWCLTVDSSDLQSKFICNLLCLGLALKIKRGVRL